MYSRFIDTNHGAIASHYYSHYAEKRFYHNWDHVIKNDKNLENLSVSYDINLDFANMWHDAIYDEKPYKEKRSADTFLQLYTLFDTTSLDEMGFDVNLVYRYIIETEDHVSVNKDNLLVKADLMGFMDDNERAVNAELLYQEAMALYPDMTEEMYYSNSIDFLTKLKNRPGIWEPVIPGIEKNIEFLEQEKRKVKS